MVSQFLSKNSKYGFASFAAILLLLFAVSPMTARAQKGKFVSKAQFSRVVHILLNPVTGKRTKVVPPPASANPNVMVNVGRQVTDLYYDDETGNTQRQLQELRRLYPDEDFKEGDQGMMVKVTYLKCEKLFSGSQAHQLRLSFYHDRARKDECKFYEIVDDFDKQGNNRVFATASDDGCAVNGDQKITCQPRQLWSHAREVNFMRKNRKNLTSFEVFVPEYIYAFADTKYPNINDSIFMFADIYDEAGHELARGTYFTSWVRYPQHEDNTCYHPDRDTTECVKSRTKLGDCIILVKYDRSWRCNICGHKEFEGDLERTEEDPDCNKKSGEHEHVWDYPEESPDFSSLKREPSQNQCYMLETWNIKVRRRCLICGLEQSKNIEDGTIVPNTNAPLTAECCPTGVYKEEVEEKPPVRVGDRMKVNKVVSTYFYCPENEKKELVGRRTETEWSESCRHDFRLESTEDLGVSEKTPSYHKSLLIYHYRCIKCGMQKDDIRSKKCNHNSTRVGKKCTIAEPWIEPFKGVPIRMRLVVYDQDTTAVYVAETETTRQLWGAVCTDNRHGWHADSKYPATGVTREEVDAFISLLNTMAVKQNVPLRFRLPEAEEWAVTYAMCNDKQGWVHDYGNALHEVAELPCNKLGLFDMKGNVSEMCSDTLSVGEPGYETTMNAVAGTSYQTTGVRHPATYQWLDMSEGKDDVGFRLFADPVDGDPGKLEAVKDEKDNANLQEVVDAEFGAGQVQVGNWWLTRPKFQCKTCGYISYGFLQRQRARLGKKPIGCD